MPHLIVVDDDPRVRFMLARYFEGEGFRVSLAKNGAQLRDALSSSIDLVLLDIELPDGSGLELAREIGVTHKTSTIIVSGRGDDIDHRIVGLEMGADDYVSKPFNLRELLARVKSVLRRTQRTLLDTGTPVIASRDFRFDGWSLKEGRRDLTSAAGEKIELTTGEFDLLLVFVSNAGRVLTRDYLMDYT